MSKQDIEKRLGFAAQGVKETARPSVKAKMATAQRSGEFDQANAILRQVASGFDIESLKEQLVSAKDVARIAPKYKELGQKLIDGINMVLSAVKQMKAESMKSSRPGVKAKFGRFSTEFGFLANQIKNQPDLAKKNIIVLAKKMGNESDITGPEFEQLVQYAEKLGMSSQVINAYDSVHPGFSRSGAKAKMAASDIIVKKDGQYIYYYPEDDDRATFPDDNGKGAYTVKSNRTGKPVSAKTYRSIQEAAAASNEMNEKLPPLKKAKSSRPDNAAKFASSYNQVSNYIELQRWLEYLNAALGKGGMIKTNNAEKVIDAALKNPNYQPKPNAVSSHELAETIKKKIKANQSTDYSRPAAKAKA